VTAAGSSSSLPQQQQLISQEDSTHEEQAERVQRAHAALLAHPIARQLRTVPRASGSFIRDSSSSTSTTSYSTSSSTSSRSSDIKAERVLIGVRFPSVWDDDLKRVLPEGQQYAPAEAAAADWGGALAALATRAGAAAGCLPRAHAEGPRALTVAACAHELEAVLLWLADQPQTHWLEPRRRMHLHNRVAGSITQGALRGDAAADVTSAVLHPFWSPAVGLRGEGQVVGVGDSGLDLDSCYFFDPNVNFAANTKTEAGGKVFASDAHRKVAYYLGRADTGMLDTVGHGTHVCGSIVGLPINAPSDTSDPAVGMAPGARVGFIDLSAAGSNDVGVPEDLDKDYYPLAYNRGVRIHSGALVCGAWGVM